MKKRIFILFAIVKYLCIPLPAQKPVMTNGTFQTEKKISDKVSCNLTGIYTKAGAATFTSTNQVMQSRSA